MKKFFLIIVGLCIAFFLNACTASDEMKLNYEGEEYEVSELQEMISDQLERENPSYDLEVSITEEVD